MLFLLVLCNFLKFRVSSSLDSPRRYHGFGKKGFSLGGFLPIQVTATRVQEKRMLGERPHGTSPKNHSDWACETRHSGGYAYYNVEKEYINEMPFFKNMVFKRIVPIPMDHLGPFSALI